MGGWADVYITDEHMDGQNKQVGPEALNCSPEYTGQSQKFNYKVRVTFDQGQRMTLTFDTHSTSLTHLAECFKQL